MKRWNVILIAVLAVELLIGSVFVYQQIRCVEPPLPDLGRLDQETAEAIISLRENTLTGKVHHWRNLAEAYLGTGFYVAAEQCFHHAYALQPTDLRSAYGYGFCLERTGNTAAAIPVLTAIAKSSDADAELKWTCWYQVGRCYLRQEDTVHAEQAFRQLPEFAPAVYQLARLLVRLDRANEAIPILEAQLELYPNEIKFIQLRRSAALATGDIRTAMDMRDREDRAEYTVEMEYGLKFIGGLSARIGLGRRLSEALSRKENGSVQEQFDTLNRALTIIRRHRLWQYRSVYLAMGELLVETNRMDEASELIREVREFSYDDSELLLLESKVLNASDASHADVVARLQRSYHLKTKVETLELLISVSKDQAQIRMAQSELVFRTGMTEFCRNRVSEALPYFEEAMSLAPNNPMYAYYCGDAWRLLGDAGKSRELLEKSLQLNPFHGRASHKLERLDSQL